MLLPLFNIIAPVLVCAAVGIAWGRGRSDFQLEFVSRLVTHVGAPCLIVAVINDARLSVADFYDMALLSLGILAGNLILGCVALRLMRQQLVSLLPPLIFPNTGNMGLSLCYFAFGEKGLALALIVFVCMSMVHFITGDMLLSRESGVRKRVFSMLRQPIIWAAFAALIMLATELQLPKAVAATTRLLGDMTIPLMLLTLGYSLAELKPRDFRLGSMLAGLRVIGGVAVGVLVARLFGAGDMATKVIVLMSAMPAAVFNYLFALKYNRQAGIVASVVVISTLMSFVTLPLLLAYLL